MTKLALYFLNQGSQCRVLDTDAAPLDMQWIVGRIPTVHIRFDQPVSKRHAIIRAQPTGEYGEENEPLYLWQIMDKGCDIGGKPSGSTNGTYINGKQITPLHWFDLEEGDVIDFATQKARIKVSFDIDDTMGSNNAWQDTKSPEGEFSETTLPHKHSGSVPWQSELIRAIHKTPNSRLAMYCVFALAGFALYLLLTGAT